MATARCLYCYVTLPDTVQDFHPACSTTMFGTPTPPVLPYSEDQMLELGLRVIKSQFALTGAQAKLSVDIETVRRESPKRFTIVGLWGAYILKPPTRQYKCMPELEDLTMHLADAAGLLTVPHSLIRLQSGTLAYITRRVDRTKTGKRHMEDMCQLTGRLTEDKYKGSYEQIAKAIVNYSANPGLDLVNFFEQVVFSFLTGNADMHLKNVSLLRLPERGNVLCPAYDMIASSLIVSGDDEELALTLNGKKRRLRRSDFEDGMSRFGLSAKVQKTTFLKLLAARTRWGDLIEASFLPPAMRKRFASLIDERFHRLKLI